MKKAKNNVRGPAVGEPEQPDLLTLLRNTHKKKTISKQDGIDIITAVYRLRSSLGEPMLREIGLALAKIEGIDNMPSRRETE
ncbi:MAG: hypothetical protein Q7R90_01115 [bacterium]|nr:hypothetical protein [bacterium]